MGTFDISRINFDKTKHYSSVRMQQGCILSDDDWNENGRIENEIQRQLNTEIIGPFGSPGNGFKIDKLRLDKGLINFDILPGTLYLGGLRLELEVLETYRLQKDWLQQPSLLDGTPAFTEKERYDLVYIETWQQAVSAVEDSSLFEVAFGGPDTTTRVRNMRRLHIAAGIGFGSCANAWNRLITDWQTGNLGKINKAYERITDTLLKVSFSKSGLKENLCSPTAAGGYLGAENQAIRVQLVDKDHFTWGFDNASPLYRVAVTSNGKTARMLTEPKDQYHWPLSNQVVEILPWSAVLSNGEKVSEQIGHLTKVESSYDPDTGEFTLIDAVAPAFGADWKKRADKDELDDQDPSEYFYLRVWNRGDDLSSDPIIKITPNSPQALGHTGLQITISGKDRIANDYWVIAARPETPNRVIPWELEKGISPHGVRRFFAPLAIIHWYKNGKNIVGEITHDCRKKFHPLTEQECCCMFTVGDGKRSNGDFNSIEEAVENLPESGGKICVLPGEHETNLTIFNRSHIWISGCGEDTIVRPRRENLSAPIFTIEQSNKIKLTGMSLVALYGIAILVCENTESQSPCHDITISDNQIVAYEHAIKIMPVQNINITEIHITHNKIAMVDKLDGGPAIFSIGDDVTIIQNQIVVVPVNNPGFVPWTSIVENPIHVIYDPCAYPIASYDWGFPVNYVVSLMMKYVTGINNMRSQYEYQTYGGIQIGGSSERVLIKENKIIGGSGNGITLGHLPEIIDEPDTPFTNVEILEQRTIKSYSYKRYVAIKVVPGKIEEAFDNEFLSSLYDIRIEENQIRLMGLSGIGVVTFFSIKETGKIILINDLTIYRNTITDCAKQIPWRDVLKLQDETGFGGICLAGCSNAIIQENRIENNGNSDYEPICGVFILSGEKIDISTNRILNNGPLTPTIGSDIIRGNRAGVFIKNASKKFDDYTPGNIKLSYFDGIPAVNIHNNIITQPLGQALFLVALGPVSVVGNILTSQGTHFMNPISLVAGSAYISNLGISKDFFAVEDILKSQQRLFYAAYLNTSFPRNENNSLSIQGQFLPGGNILFNDNQTTLELRRSESEMCFSSLLMNSFDDISFCGNQCDVMSYVTAKNQVIDAAILNVYLAGFSIRSNSSRFQEGKTFVVYSLYSNAFINTAIGNQATHCLIVQSPCSRIASQNNIILLNELCPAAEVEFASNSEGLETT
jgi:hypothetical protein